MPPGQVQVSARIPEHWHRQWRRRLEAGALAGLLAMVRAVPVATASNIGGALARGIGPWLPVSQVAERNLRRAMAELDRAQRRQIIRGVWDNLGRTVAELPHVAALGRVAPHSAGPGFEFCGERGLAALRARGGPALFFSAHIGNWELILPAAARLGLSVSGFYRAAGNPLVDAIVRDLRLRPLHPDARLFAKGASGARAALAHLARGGLLGMLVDQKMNDGIALPFFGRPAMTAPALAQLALRFGCPVIPVHVRRLGPARFRVIWEDPLALPDSGDRQADIAVLMAEVNATVERWVRAEPQSWLWLHRRWLAEPSGHGEA